MNPSRQISRRQLVFGACAFGIGCGTRAQSSVTQRIISTSPSTTEMVFALGVGAKLVGRTRFCDYPPEAKQVEEIGGFADPNLERVVALAPTLVCGERGPAGESFVQALGSRQIATFFPAINSYEQVQSALRELAGLVGRPNEGHELVKKLSDQRDQVAKQTAALPRPRVAFVFDWQPPILAGESSFPGALLHLAGADNAFKGGGQYPKLSAEGFFALDPDVIIDGSTHGESSPDPLSLLPTLRSLRAVEQGALHTLASPRTLRPGPRIGEGLLELSRMIHGERSATK